MWREFVKLAEKKDDSFATLCTRFGISRKTGYKWLKRYRAQGLNGLQPQSRRPKSSPRRTPDHVVDALLDLRATQPDWSIARLHEEMSRQAIAPLPAPSTIDLILRRQREATDVPTAHEPATAATESNFRWILALSPEILLADGTPACAAFVRDETTGFLVGATLLTSRREEALLAFASELMHQHGLPWRMQIPRAEELRDQPAARAHSPLSVWLLRHGILVEFAYGQPEANPAAGAQARKELAAQLAQLPAYQSTILSSRVAASTPEDLFGQAAPGLTAATAPHFLAQLRDQHNFGGRQEAMQQRSPVSRFRPSLRRMPGEIPAPARLFPKANVRLISEKGIFTFQRRLVHVGRAFARMTVEIRPTPYPNRHHVVFAGHFLGSFNLAVAPIGGTTSLLLSRI